jgi:aspartate/methionine/tyrosine aminotransferase
MSKDFGSNGLRVGVLVSQHNPDLIKSFGVSGILMKVSSPAVSLPAPSSPYTAPDSLPIQDVLWTSIIGDQKVLGPYLEEAQTRAGDTLAFTFDWLEKLNIGHSNPVAGHFIWCDMRAYLPKFDKHGKKIDDPAKQEFELFMRLLNDGNVYVAPGSFYHSQIPGFFRLTFTVRREYLKVGFGRVEKIFKQVQKENEDLESKMKSLQV